MHVGGGIVANNPDLGKNVILAGLGLQIIWFGFFVVVSVAFHYRMRNFRVPPEQSSWRRLMYILYIASLLILVRSIFRMIEFQQGNTGPLLSKEVVRTSAFVSARLTFRRSIFTSSMPS